MAKVGVTFFFLFSIFLLAWSYSELSDVFQLISSNEKAILVNTTFLYSLLISIFLPIMFFMLFEHFGNSQLASKYAIKTIIIWAVASFITSFFILPPWLDSTIKNKGYIPCAIKKSSSIRNPSHKMIYQIPPCDYELISTFKDKSIKKWQPILYEAVAE